jgi:hypothetical protein
MLITIDKDVFETLEGACDKPLSDEYVSATDGQKVIRLPILVSSVKDAMAISVKRRAASEAGLDEDEVAPARFIVVSYDGRDTETEREIGTERVNDLSEAVNLMVKNSRSCFYAEICVDDGEQSIYGIMQW